MLFAQKKVVTVGKVSDFVKGAKESVKELPVKTEWLPLILTPVSLPFAFDSLATHSFAATTGKAAVSNQVMNAFNPLIDLIQGLAYPVTFLSLTVAGIHWILDNKERAVAQIQGSAIGFIIVQMAPMLMKLLVQITAGF